MKDRRFFQVFLMCCATGVTTFACSAEEPEIGEDEQKFVTAAKPALICQSINRAAFDTLMAGNGRLTLVVKSYEAGNSQSHEFKVSLVNSETDEKIIATRFGLFPGTSFKSDTPEDYQRFQVPVARHKDALTYSKQLCLEVSFGTPNAKTKNSAAEVDIEIN
ncbi:hypothetical protein [Anderseniella sp. Alg231-50]|uniref:hypothetical protein n=1 Tax=Anderseniella sp. Alg231-50 TaxID=1922226 RepID=UPI000D557F17